MNCPRCQHGNPSQARIWPVARDSASGAGSAGPNCQARPASAFPAANKFNQVASTPRFDSPGDYTPKHLAEKILNSKAALEGERKQITVLFADLKGSEHTRTIEAKGYQP